MAWRRLQYGPPVKKYVVKKQNFTKDKKDGFRKKAPQGWILFAKLYVTTRLDTKWRRIKKLSLDPILTCLLPYLRRACAVGLRSHDLLS